MICAKRYTLSNLETSAFARSSWRANGRFTRDECRLWVDSCHWHKAVRGQERAYSQIAESGHSTVLLIPTGHPSR